MAHLDDMPRAAAAVDQEDDATDQIDGATGIREPWIVFRARDEVGVS